MPGSDHLQTEDRILQYQAAIPLLKSNNIFVFQESYRLFTRYFLSERNSWRCLSCSSFPAPIGINLAHGVSSSRPLSANTFDSRGNILLIQTSNRSSTSAVPSHTFPSHRGCLCACCIRSLRHSVCLSRRSVLPPNRFMSRGREVPGPP